jgi:hypothetical protein
MTKGIAEHWYRTAMANTRVFRDGSFKHLGHVRNIGARKWRCEYYPTNETFDADSLTGGKEWVEMTHKLQGKRP